MDHKVRVEEYRQLCKEMEESPGFKYLERRSEFYRSVKIFGGNFRELGSLICSIENPDKYIHISEEEKDYRHSEVIRLFTAVPLTFTVKPSDWWRVVCRVQGRLVARPSGLVFQTD